MAGGTIEMRRSVEVVRLSELSEVAKHPQEDYKDISKVLHQLPNTKFHCVVSLLSPIRPSKTC